MALGNLTAEVFFADVFGSKLADEFVAADVFVGVDGAALAF